MQTCLDILVFLFCSEEVLVHMNVIYEERVKVLIIWMA